tara:strand:+ start:4716 stop:4994 length:279 start_codon:yes stop_codon:yes gene_type:complete
MTGSDTPLICGGIYEIKRPDGSTEQSIVTCTIKGPSGTKGWIQRFGLAREIVVEGSEVFNTMKLVGTAAKTELAKESPKTETKKKIRRKKKE